MCKQKKKILRYFNFWKNEKSACQKEKARLWFVSMCYTGLSPDLKIVKKRWGMVYKIFFDYFLKSAWQDKNLSGIILTLKQILYFLNLI